MGRTKNADTGEDVAPPTLVAKRKPRVPLPFMATHEIVLKGSIPSLALGTSADHIMWSKV